MINSISFLFFTKSKILSNDILGYLDDTISTAPCIFKNSVQSLRFIIANGRHYSRLEMKIHTKDLKLKGLSNKDF